LQCPAGSGVVSGTNAADDASCVLCNAGLFDGTFSASNDAKQCKPFTVRTCIKGMGWEQGTATADTACTPCGIGFFSTTVSADPCTASSCPMGEYFVSKPDEPQSCNTTCDAGMHTVVSACVPCAPGTHNNIQNAKTCSGTPCVAGTYGPAGSKLKADVACTPCAEGMYSSSGKAIASIHPSDPEPCTNYFSKPFAAPLPTPSLATASI